MPFVSRDADGRIVAVHAEPTDAAREAIDAGDPALQAFLGLAGEASTVKERFETADLGFIRVLEDLINALLEKRVILMTDLPAAARAKLVQRRALRSKLADLGDVVAHGEKVMLP